jgi:multiple sugar transport system permease protein
MSQPALTGPAATSAAMPTQAAGRGMSDLAIRNWFIIPTIVFLIVFNIFPLIYSLGYSFTDFRASVNTPANFVGLQNYRELLGDEYVWNNFTITAKYVLVSVGGQVLVGFGVALLLNRNVPGKGLVTTLLLLPMMLSMAVVGSFDCSTSVLGQINYAGAGASTGSLSRWPSAPVITDIWMGALRHAAVARRPLGDPSTSTGGGHRPAGPGMPSRQTRCRWCALLLIA